MKILTKKQLEIVNDYKDQYDIDITDGWFIFDVSDSDDEDFDYFICVQPKSDLSFDQDAMCEPFFPKNINLDYYCETIYGYSGDKKTLIDSLESTEFFKYSPTKN